MSKHTPGPWMWTYDEPFCPDIVDANGNRVPGLRCWDDDACVDGNPERHANQQLAAAAPDLLEALTRFGITYPLSGWCGCVRPSEDSTQHDERCTQARAAIAKAEGK